MIKKIGLVLLLLGVGSGIAQILSGDPVGNSPRLVALSWINFWGETTGWGIRGLLVFIGGGMLFLENLMGDEGLEGEVKK